MANSLRGEVIKLYKNVSVLNATSTFLNQKMSPLSLCTQLIKTHYSFLSKLLYLGREYPKGADYFRSRLKAAFLKNKDEKDPEKIKQLIARGEFVIKELEALYFLRKYRAMKQRYYSEDKP